MTLAHPRPQLVRDSMISLDGEWEFADDPHDEGVRERWHRGPGPFPEQIRVPYPPESTASGIGRDVDGAIWYRRPLTYEPTEEHRMHLHFEGVDYRAQVWVNGELAGEHEGGQSRFSLDITDLLREGSNTLVVRAEDPARDLEIPRGKQDWQAEPHVIWYRRTSGIWRSVWLEQVPQVHLERLVLQAQEDLASVSYECRVAGAADAGVAVELEWWLEDRCLATVRQGCPSGHVRGTVRLDHESLDAEPETLWWSPDRPRLIDVRVRILRDGRVLDDVGSYLGLRTVGTDERHVLLNGRPLFLRLVLEQAYWPDTHLASPSLEALEQEARLIKALGFNGVRLHQTSADPRFLALCDRLGLLVLADTAAAYRYSNEALTRTAVEAARLVQRDINHPCVIGWVPFNESWGVPRLRTSDPERHAVIALHALMKALDPSRLVLGNDGWEHIAGDLVGVHDYEQDPDRLRARYGSPDALRDTVSTGHTGGRRIILAADAPAAPVVLTEFGGINVHEDDAAWTGYGQVIKPTDLPSRMRDLVEAISGGGLAGYCYTQLTDTRQEKNGLADERRSPKCDPALLREVLHERLHP